MALSAQFLLSSMCFWQPYELLTDVPREALVFGYTWLGSKAVPTYMARFEESTMLRIIPEAGKYEACDFNMKCQQRKTPAAILSCHSNSTLRWQPYQPNMNLDGCIVFGKTHSGETIYVSRQKAVHPRSSPVSTYNLLRGGIFIPSQGFSITEIHGPYPDDDFQLLCL